MPDYRGYDEVRIIPRDGREYHLDDMSDADLTELELLLSGDLTGIKDALGQAHTRLITDGEYSDPDWYRRANTARRIKARQIVMVQRQRKALRRAAHAARGGRLPDFFMDAARLILNEKAFRAIHETAETMLADALERVEA
jgi:hypothetical protein